MEFTGERFVPGVQGAMKLEHLQRYALCRALVTGRRVADVACGEGYGSAMLAATASHVVGVDSSAETIHHASGRYRGSGPVHFLVGRAEQLPLASASIDVVVSFETIEHLADQEACVDEFARVLAPGGRLILSSPEASVYSQAMAANPFHVHELTREELTRLLARRFPHVRLWGQRPGIGTFTYDLNGAAHAATTLAALTVEGDSVRAGVGALPSPWYLLAVASQLPLGGVDLDTVVVEPGDDAFAAQVATIRAYQAECRRLEQGYDDASARLADERRRSALAVEERGRLAEELAHDRRHFAGQVAVQADRIHQLERELALVVGSRSWRLTAPLRRARTVAGRVKHDVALGLERRMRTAFRRLPIQGQQRWRLKSAVFERLGWLMRGTASYQHWAGTQRRALAARRAAGRPNAASLQVASPITLPWSDAPDVSVIIPAYGQGDLTRRCLASIATHPPRATIEVLLVDDASPEDLDEVFSDVAGLRVIRNEVNSGFIRTCNHGAREARGRYLLFLNNDTEVTPGWCDELLETFASAPEAGIVGSKLVYPDGTLQEAGGIIWQDGSGWNFGKFEDPAAPEYSYRREVDYVSGAAVMLPARLFWEVGAFDERYAPAYGEDSDLAFKVRAAGRRVYCQPLSVVIHHEGATSGTDLSAGVKAYQVRNQGLLAERWRDALQRHHEPGESVRLARERGVGLRVLVLDLCTPEPDKDAGSITAAGIMSLLQRLGCKITFAPVDNFLFLERYTADLQRMGIECLYAPFVTSIDDYLQAHGPEFDLVLVFRFLTAERHLEAIRRHAPRAPVWLHTSDLHFLREQREADLRADRRIAETAERMKRKELDVIARVDCTIVHSTYEQQVLANESPDARVAVFGWAIDAPGTTTPFDTRRDIGFIGGYQHPPNVDGAMYFARDVLPIVRATLPDVRFFVIGSNPPDELRALDGDRVSVTGFIPDLAPVLDGLRLSVAPLRYGAGIKGKIGTSLAHGLPCVGTPLAVEGMNLTDGHDVLVGGSPEALAEAVIRAYTDPALWQRLSDNGLAFVRRQYSFEGGLALFRDLLESSGLRPAVDSPVQTDGLELASVSSLAEDESYRERMRERSLERRAIERSFLPRSPAPFSVDGFCTACLDARTFRVTYDYALRGPGGEAIPNWREHLVCQCGLNARTRAALHVVLFTLGTPPGARIYLMEQRSPLYHWMHQRFPGLVGSEYLGDAVPLGAIRDGIRNEDATRLTFAAAAFDRILSFDVLEHVPDYQAAFVEAARCLRPGGSFIFTAPFDRGSAATVHRARLTADGTVEHLLEPEYHGDPIDPSGRILCFQHFGWDIVPALERVGFSRVSAQLLWSRRLGFLGDEQMIFVATR
jgi:GT2 family glycosyltransferase/ubiquinone/menaquinone biosynthesis C-methylase UbiE/glycosyltransferase involved in cell wall biosynthesis